MLADDRVVLLQLDALTRIDLVLARHVDVAGIGGTTQLDDRTTIFALGGHDSDLLSGLAHVGHDTLDAHLVDGAQTLGAYVQRDPTLLRRQPEALPLGVHPPPALGLDVGVRDGVARRGLLPEDVAAIWHPCIVGVEGPSDTCPTPIHLPVL